MAVVVAPEDEVAGGDVSGALGWGRSIASVSAGGEIGWMWNRGLN